MLQRYSHTGYFSEPLALRQGQWKSHKLSFIRYNEVEDATASTNPNRSPIMELGTSKEEPGQTITFVSLGMAVLDELRFSGRRPLTDVLGGSGAYGMETRCCCHRSPHA